MKHKHCFLIVVYCLCAMMIANAMEKKATTLADITLIKGVEKPLRIACLTNSRVVIASAEGCYLVDVIQDIVLKKINEFDYSSSNNKLDLKACSITQKIATYNDKNVQVYDGITGTKEWSAVTIKPIKYFDCSFFNNTIFVCYGDTKCNNNAEPDNRITRYNYKENCYRDIFIKDQNCVCVTVHPREEKIFTMDTFGNASFYTLKDEQMNVKKIVLLGGINCFTQCFYSPDGSCIAATNYRDVVFIDPAEREPQYPVFDFCDFQYFGVTKFHPNGEVWVVLTPALSFSQDRSTCINYCSIKPTNRIDSLHCEVNDISDFAFSPDGKFVIITACSEYKVLRVADEVRYFGYEVKRISDLPFYLCILNSLVAQNYLLKEVKQTIASVLLSLFRCIKK